MATVGETSRPGYVYDSATDVWIPVGIGPHSHTPAAIGAISSSVVTTKGDLIVATASGIVNRLAVGANGETLIADSSTSTGLRWQGDYAAGKNKIINGDMGVWQRGTSFSNPAVGSFSADRWRFNNFDVAPTTYSTSQQTFTPGTAPVAGYEGTYFLRSEITTVGSNTAYDPFAQRIEDVRTFAGQTVTLSFWAKTDSARTIQIQMAQNFGSGGSASVTVTAFASNNFSATTAWQRFTVTVAVPSISGKTIGTSSFLLLIFRQISASGSVLDLWGVQLEATSTASNFQTATGTKQGELAACQRYYWQSTGGNYQTPSTSGYIESATLAILFANLPVPMRIAPTVLGWSTLQVLDGNGGGFTPSTIVLNTARTTTNAISLDAAITGGTAGRFAYLRANNSSSAYLAASAEL
jgi:hypothetical protein